MQVIHRRVKDTDFFKIQKLFLQVFNRKISKKFYQWRYKDNSKYNCFIAIYKNEIIGHVGFIRFKLNRSIELKEKK